MMKKPALSAMVGAMIWVASLGQTADSQRIDDELTAAFVKLKEADYDTRADRLAPLFKKQLLAHLANPVTFSNPLDKLAKYVVIQTSADKKLKFYSWDDLTGGTWHHITTIAQFITDEGKIVGQPLNPEDERETGEFTDCLVYEVHDLAIDGARHYLTFGRGTHGSSHQHSVIRVFRISGNELVECADCFAPDLDLAIEYPRTDTLNLAFNPESNEITYDEYKWDDETGRNKPTGRIVTLKLTNGKFIRK